MFFRHGWIRLPITNAKAKTCKHIDLQSTHLGGKIVHLASGSRGSRSDKVGKEDFFVMGGYGYVPTTHAQANTCEHIFRFAVNG